MGPEEKEESKNEVGAYWEEARIEQIGVGFRKDTLMISNRKSNLWVFSVFNGYEQLGIFKVEKHHGFKEGQNILIRRENLKKKFLGIPFSDYYVVEVRADE